MEPHIIFGVRSLPQGMMAAGRHPQNGVSAAGGRGGGAGGGVGGGTAAGGGRFKSFATPNSRYVRYLQKQEEEALAFGTAGAGNFPNGGGLLGAYMEGFPSNPTGLLLAQQSAARDAATGGITLDRSNVAAAAALAHSLGNTGSSFSSSSASSSVSSSQASGRLAASPLLPLQQQQQQRQEQLGMPGAEIVLPSDYGMHPSSRRSSAAAARARGRSRGRGRSRSLVRGRPQSMLQGGMGSSAFSSSSSTSIFFPTGGGMNAVTGRSILMRAMGNNFPKSAWNSVLPDVTDWVNDLMPAAEEVIPKLPQPPTQPPSSSIRASSQAQKDATEDIAREQRRSEEEDGRGLAEMEVIGTTKPEASLAGEGVPPQQLQQSSSDRISE